MSDADREAEVHVVNWWKMCGLSPGGPTPGHQAAMGMDGH